MEHSYILAIDQGTSSTKALIFDGEGRVVFRASELLNTCYYEGGRVEQDPEEIFRNVLAAVRKCISGFKAGGGDPGCIRGCGISNQRETFVLWDEHGKPLYPAVVWQCKRSVPVCERLEQEGLADRIRAATGLLIDPYFSGTKLIWLQEQVAEVREAIRQGKAYFGTIDTWLLFRLTRRSRYLTDFTNASRTLFFNLDTLGWDRELLERFGLSGIHLPEPRPSAHPFGESDFEGLFPEPVPITAMIGDSHAAAFGEGCFSPGTAKATLGTGCSLMMNTGSRPEQPGKGMVTTICWSLENRVDYALEGVIVSCGSTIEWLKNELGLFTDSSQTENMATAVPDNNGVYLVPAFSGLGAPYWEMSRRASVTGLTFDCNKNHLVRAALESIPYQIRDVIEAMESGTPVKLQELMVDGGMTANRFVLQFLAGLLGKPVLNSGMADVSAMGAAWLAGLQAGVYKDLDRLKAFHAGRIALKPDTDEESLNNFYAGWKKAVRGAVS